MSMARFYLRLKYYGTMFELQQVKNMKAYTFLFLALSASFFGSGCNSNREGDVNPTLDSTSSNPTTDALDYHPDQTQEIPRTDSSNIIGTDSVGASESIPNTGTVKTYNTKKGTKDTIQKQ